MMVRTLHGNLKPDISIIMPVYNTSKYLDRSIESVLHQTFTNFELIVVNDGSTDNSLEILQQYASSDSRIRILSKNNEGVMLARRSGLELAVSEYIYYLDSDDYLDVDFLKLVYHKMKESNADVVLFNFKEEYTDKAINSIQYHKTEFTNIEFLELILSDRGYVAVWTYMHKRTLYNDIRYQSGLSIGEDAYLTVQLIYNADKIIYIDTKPLLHYVIHESSVFHSPLNSDKANAILLYPKLISVFLESKPEYIQLREALACLEISANILLFKRAWFKNAKQQCRHINSIIQEFPQLKKYPTYRSYRKLIKLLLINRFIALVFVSYYRKKGKIF